MRQREVIIKGDYVSCPKVANTSNGSVFIGLEECKKCEYFKGVDVVRLSRPEIKDDNGTIKQKPHAELYDVLCCAPTRIRTSRLFEGVL